MKLGTVPDEAAILSAPGGGAIDNALRWFGAVVSAGFNLEHDTETSRHTTIRATGTIAERGRTIAIGDWINIPYGTLAFAGNATAWDVGVADVITLKYMLIGHTLFYRFYLDTTSVTAGNSTLRLPLPPGFAAAASDELPFTYSDNGTLGAGIAQVLTSDNAVVRLFTASAANWAASANATRVAGQLMIEIT